jgi:RNA binding exosome subunit
LKGPIQSVEVTYLVHATEDKMKVEGAVGRLLGITIQPVVERLEGHFGNEILSVKLHLTGEEAAKAVKSVITSLPDDVRAELVANTSEYLDEHSAFFLRLDKQRLVSGILAIGAGDSVRLKLKPRLFLVKGGAPEFYAKLIGGP